MNIPQADALTDQGEQMDYGIAYSLLSKPTLEINDSELLLIAQDLRAKRVKFLAGVADRPGKTAVPKKAKPTEEEKGARTGHLKNLIGGARLVFGDDDNA